MTNVALFNRIEKQIPQYVGYFRRLAQQTPTPMELDRERRELIEDAKGYERLQAQLKSDPPTKQQKAVLTNLLSGLVQALKELKLKHTGLTDVVNLVIRVLEAIGTAPAGLPSLLPGNLPSPTGLEETSEDVKRLIGQLAEREQNIETELATALKQEAARYVADQGVIQEANGLIKELVQIVEILERVEKESTETATFITTSSKTQVTTGTVQTYRNTINRLKGDITNTEKLLNDFSTRLNDFVARIKKLEFKDIQTKRLLVIITKSARDVHTELQLGYVKLIQKLEGLDKLLAAIPIK